MLLFSKSRRNADREGYTTGLKIGPFLKKKLNKNYITKMIADTNNFI